MQRRARGPWQRVRVAGLLVGCVAGAAQSGEPRLSEMPTITVEVDGGRYAARLAATPVDRRAGFQHVAPEAMRDVVICFRYEQPRRPSFHMRNVARALYLVWLAPDGVVRGVDHAEPGGSGYRPEAPVSGVLELVPGHPLAEKVARKRRVAGC